MSGHLRLLLVVLCCLACGWQAPAHAALTLDHATATVAVQGAAAPGQAADVALPYHWDRLHGAVDGEARFVMKVATADPASLQAIYLPRIGSSFTIHFNGTLIGRRGSGKDSAEDYAKRPHMFLIPPEKVGRENELAITIHVQGGRNGGLSTVTLGTREEVDDLFIPSYRWRVHGALVVAIVSLVLGSFALLLWLRQKEGLYLTYAASEMLWAVYNSDVLFAHPPLPWRWWGSIVFSAEALAAILIMKFALMVVEQHHGLIRRATTWNLWLAPPAVFLGVIGGLPWMEPLIKCATDTVSLCAVCIIVRHGLASRDIEKRVLAVALLAMSCVAVRDEMVLVFLPYSGLVPAYANQYAEVAWSRNVWAVYGIALAWIIAERMRRASREVARMNETLSLRLAEREAELSAMFSLQASAAREQAMLEERQRLTRDMHDGLGSELLCALQLAQDPAVARNRLAAQLSETLDHLKLTVDAMQDTEGDIATLLGALRYRMRPRLEAAGVQLRWSVDALPAIEGWTLQHSRDLQMILFEAFSNLVAHAGASEAALQALFDGAAGQIRITLRDNGAGFAPGHGQGGHGQGTANMRARAARIQADLHIASSRDGVTTTLTLPRHLPVQAGRLA